MAPLSVPDTFDSFEELWSPHLIASVNDHHVKIAKIDGPFEFHAHPNSDELFYIVSGKMTLEIEGGPNVPLSVGDVYVVPRGVRHRPVAEKAHIIMVEKEGTMNTGDAPESKFTKPANDVRFLHR